MMAAIILPSWIQLAQKNSLIHSDSTWWWADLCHFDSAILQKNFTHSFWLNLMMAAILNSAMFNLVSLDSAILVFLLNSLTLPRLVPTICIKKLYSFILSTWWWQQSWICIHLELCHLGFSHFAQKKLHSFILTQLDDGSHLEFCHAGFRYCHLGFRHLVIFSQIYSKTLSLHSDSDSN